MTKRFLLLFLIIFCLCFELLIAQKIEDIKPVSKKVKKMIKAAQKSVQSKKFDKALEIYQKIIEIEPQYAQSYFKIALILNTQKKYSKAIENFEKAITLQPKYPQAVKAYIQTVLVLAQKKQTQNLLNEANKYYLKILDIKEVQESEKKIQLKTLYQLGLNYFNIKEHKKSVEYLITFIKIPGVETEFNNFFSIANYLIGINFNHLKNFEKSNEYLLNFLELEKKSPQNTKLIPLANFLIGLNFFNPLEAKIQKINKTDLKKIYELAKEKKEIESHLSKAIELRPDIEEAYLKLGNYYYYCGDLEKSSGIYKKLIEKFPNSPDLSSYKTFLKKLKELNSKNTK